MSQLRRQFAKRLKSLRRQKGMTQKELAQAADLSVSFVRSMEQAVYAPSFESIEKIADAMTVEAKELFSF